MTSEDVTLVAATAVVRGLARNEVPPYNSPNFDLPTKNATANGRFSLPGTDNAAKEVLENELSALSARIQFLEGKASTVNHETLPDTPSESGPTSPFANGSVGAARNGVSRPVRQLSGSKRQAHVSNLLRGHSLPFTEEDLAHLRDHVDQQANEIKAQKDVIDEVKEELMEQKKQATYTFDMVQQENLESVTRELAKHQQANEAFKKALKEIGTIITNVANGDLSQKIQIHVKEMDPEIERFKRTINTMMDQLQVFGNEVSRVALEVGTEGKLGGQAQITGVSGVWRGLTQNGEYTTGSIWFDFGPNK